MDSSGRGFIFMNLSDLLSRLQPSSPPLGLAMDPKIFALLVAILFFLISLLINLLQHRYSKARFNHMLAKEESVLSFLTDINKILVNMEWISSVGLNGASFPPEVQKAVHGTRNKIESNIADMKKHLHSFRQYRKKEKGLKKQEKRPEKSHPAGKRRGG